jgi:hypothetical protein
MEHDNQHPQQPTNNLLLLSTHDAVNDKDAPKNADSGHEAQTNKTPRLMGSKEHVHMAEEMFHTDENIVYANPETETDVKEAFSKTISKKRRQQLTHSDDSIKKRSITPREKPNHQYMKRMYQRLLNPDMKHKQIKHHD